MVLLRQARKSLWIETARKREVWGSCTVRLVRACGSKQRDADSQLYNEQVRLVRACGSKPMREGPLPRKEESQARKSLWIETILAV